MMILRIRALLPYFIRYVLIGGFVFVIDIGTFGYFLHLTWPWEFLNTVDRQRLTATVGSLSIAFTTHFMLNKHFNFRNFDRPTREQFSTYLVVALFCTLVSIGVIEGCVRALGMGPLIAKCIAVAVNIPIGFVGHKKLTFGRGLRAVAFGARRAPDALG